MDPSVGTAHREWDTALAPGKPLEDWLPGAPDGLSTLF